MKPPVFVDQVTLYVESGRGGDGSCSFRREKYVPQGGPDGGDGGRGGHVILTGDTQSGSLLPLYYQPHQRAEHGGRGGRRQMTGRNGRDLKIPVPCGTVVRNQETNEVLGEILTDGQVLQVAQGGRGGLGNLHFVSSTNRTPRQFTPGGENQVLTLRLELKLIAPVGLVGYPNAGKSTLIRQISRAHPKVASYPFTTLHPVLGVVTFSDYRTVRVADLPGLIEGAHAGVGLGHAFLRHIERTELLVFVLDCAGVDGRTPQADYEHLLDELERHEAGLLQRPRLLVANKMDLPGADEHLAEFVAATGTQPIPISARDGTGLEALRAAIETHFFPPADSHPAAGAPDEIPS